MSEDQKMVKLARPNFFIIGAPKCGTTALYTYLSQNKRICMPWIKEPHYFANEIEKSRIRPIDNLTEYLGLFKHYGRACEAIGEASVFYINSPCAIGNIYSFNKLAKIIIMVREPVEMFASLHCQLYFTHDENLKNPVDAWRAQIDRRKGWRIPKTSRIPHILQYQSTCSLGKLTKKVIDIFPSNNVKIIFFEDFANKTKKVYEEVLKFLGVSSDGREHFPRVNKSKVSRSRFLTSLYHEKGILRPLWCTLEEQRKRRGINYNLAFRSIYYFLHRFYLLIDSKTLKRTPFKVEFRRELQDTFKEDIGKLSKLTGRNLTHWLSDNRLY